MLHLAKSKRLSIYYYYRFSILITINKEINISSINLCPRGKTVRVALGRGGDASGGGETNTATWIGFDALYEDEGRCVLH